MVSSIDKSSQELVCIGRCILCAVPPFVVTEYVISSPATVFAGWITGFHTSESQRYNMCIFGCKLRSLSVYSVCMYRGLAWFFLLRLVALCCGIAWLLDKTLLRKLRKLLDEGCLKKVILWSGMECLGNRRHLHLVHQLSC